MTNLYHVSPASNRASILRSGIDPIYSTGARQLVWLVDGSKLMWAVAHCSARHGVSTDKLDIWTVPFPRRTGKTAWRGVFTTPCRNVTQKFEPASEYIERAREK